MEPFLQRRGILLVSVFQSHIGYAAPVLETLGKVAVIRKPQGNEGSDYFPKRLLEWRDALEVIPADAGGGMRLFQILRNGGTSGCTTTSSIPMPAPFAACFSAGTCPCVANPPADDPQDRGRGDPDRDRPPPSRRGQRGGGMLFSSAARFPLARGGDRAALAIQLSLATECLIRRFPVQWRLWNTLQLRWARAGELP